MAHRNRDARQAAEATAAANLKAAQAAAQANRVNQTTPFGNINYSQTGPNQWSVEQTLSPALQSLLQQSQTAQGSALGSVQNLLNAGIPSINTAGLGDLYNIDLGQLPALPQWDTSGFTQLQGIDLGALDRAGLFGNINLGALPAVTQLPVNAGMTGQRAIMTRLQPQIDRQRQQLQSELINQGFNTSDTGYRQGMLENNQSANDLLNQAALYGINLDFTSNQLSQAQRAAALNEQQTAAQLALANRGQALGEQTAASDAARGNYAQQLAALLGQTNYGLSSYNAQLDAQKAMAANALTNRQQGWNESYQQAGMPLNYLQSYLSLLSGLGGLVQSPGQYGINVPQQETTGGANYLTALQTANQQRASEGANRAGLLGGLGSALGTAGLIGSLWGMTP